MHTFALKSTRELIKMTKNKNYASRCKACNTPLESFSKSKSLEDGTFDDLCSTCKDAIKSSYGFRFNDYICAESEDGSVSEILPTE